MKKKFIFITVMIIILLAGFTAITYKTDIIKKIVQIYPNTYNVSEEEAKAKAIFFFKSIGIQESSLIISKYNYFGLNPKIRENENSDIYTPFFKLWPAYSISSDNYDLAIHGQTGQILGFSQKEDFHHIKENNKMDSTALEKKAQECMKLLDSENFLNYQYDGLIRSNHDLYIYKFKYKPHTYLGNTISKTPVYISHYEINLYSDGNLYTVNMVWEY